MNKLLAHRMSLWLWISLALLVIIQFIAPHMLGVVLYKIALLTIAGYVGFALALAIEGCLGFKVTRKRPHEYQAEAAGVRQEAADLTRVARQEAYERAWQLEQQAMQMLLRRAILVSAVLVAAALGS